MWDKRGYIRDKRCYIRDNRHATFDILTHDVPNYPITSVFCVCDVGLCNSDSKFQTSIAPLFIKISSVGMCFLS